MNYGSFIQNLPLEILESKFILEYLPPGGKIASYSKFWLRFLKVRADEDQEALSALLNDPEIYLEIAREYIFQLNQPGKALMILQEAVQSRQITGGLTKIALQAVEHTFITNISNRQDRQKKIGDLFGLNLSLNDSVKSILVSYHSNPFCEA